VPVELAQRAQAIGLTVRQEDADGRRVVRLALTDKGAAALEQLTSLHRQELVRLGDDLRTRQDDQT
jgi:DNA-binding MarR family transcriptional regulator